jgi:hypothetical protein
MLHEYHVICSVRYYPRSHVTAVGLGTYYPWIRGHYSTTCQHVSIASATVFKVSYKNTNGMEIMCAVVQIAWDFSSDFHHFALLYLNKGRVSATYSSEATHPVLSVFTCNVI